MMVSVLLRILYGFRNRTNVKNRRAQLEGLSLGEVLTTPDQDETDRKNPAFVYVY